MAQKQSKLPPWLDANSVFGHSKTSFRVFVPNDDFAPTFLANDSLVIDPAVKPREDDFVVTFDGKKLIIRAMASVNDRGAIVGVVVEMARRRHFP
jgi:hypothetical protein